MPVFDQLTTSGSLNTQAEVWTQRPSCATSNSTNVTLDTITVASGTVVGMEYLLVGRNTSTGAAWAERGVVLWQNVSGVISTIAFGVIWTNSAGQHLFQVVSAPNVTLQTPSAIAGPVDWQLLVDAWAC